MKIKDLKTFVVGTPPPHHGGPYWVFLTLTTDNGIKGVGEVYGVPFDPHLVARMIEDVGAAHVVGRDPFQIETLWRIVYSRAYAQRPDMTLLGVLSGIEMACWDIVGKALDQPVYNLLGGRVHEGLRSYTYLYADAEAALVPDLDGLDERQDSVDMETPKISELNRVLIWGSAN